MVRIATGLVAAVLMVALSASVSAELQPPGGEGPPKKGQKGDKKGRPPFGDKEGDRKGPPMGKGFRFGQVLPPFAYAELELSKEQTAKIQALEAEVAAQLEKILTGAQLKQLEELRPPMGPGGFGGPGRFGPGGPGGDRKGPPGGDRKGPPGGDRKGPPRGERPAEPAPMPRPVA